MVDSGKEFLMVDSYNIQWLIWIQMFVFFLLLLLLCTFGNFSSDISDNSFSSADSIPFSFSSSSLSRRLFSGDPISISHHGSKFSANSCHVQSNQMGSSQAIDGEITTRTEEEEDWSLEKDPSRNLNHPCNLLQLAGSAFLNCLGLTKIPKSRMILL